MPKRLAILAPVLPAKGIPPIPPLKPGAKPIKRLVLRTMPPRVVAFMLYEPPAAPWRAATERIGCAG